jgi:hypothetical protein
MRTTEKTVTNGALACAKVHNGRPRGQQSTRQADGLEMSARDDR